MTKRLLMITGSYPPIQCGVGDYSAKLTQALSEQNVEVTVLTSVHAESSNANEILVLNIIENWKGISYLHKVFQVVSDGSYDIIHIQHPTTEYGHSIFHFFLPFFLRITGHKVVFTLHEYAYSGIAYKICRIPAIFSSNKLIVVDDINQKELCKKYPLLKKKIVQINIGSNIPPSNADDDTIRELRSSILKSYSYADTIISYFGFLTKNKCMELLFSALKSLKDEGKLHTVFLIIGKPKEQDDYQHHLLSLISDLGLEENIFITGYVPAEKVGDYFRTSNAAMLLFEKGVSPRNGSFLAASQEKIPVITSESEQIRAYLSDETNVFLIQNRLEEIKESILAVQARQLVLGKEPLNMAWDKIATDHIKLYDSL